jgi:hypothetical protein
MANETNSGSYGFAIGAPVVGFVKARDSGCRRAFVIGGTEESMELAPLVGLRESGEAGR